ncbi:MAG: tetratricopeptide repeat protein [Candidatus Sulfotelmatobacter sp.]
MQTWPSPHIDAVLEDGELANYYLAHSARADMYRRLGRTAEARASYEKALSLTQQEPEAGGPSSYLASITIAMGAPSFAHFCEGRVRRLHT